MSIPDRPIWPDGPQLLGSDLFALMGQDLARDPGGQALMALVLRYAFHECLFLASALAQQAGEPVGIVRYSIVIPDDPARLLHAVLVRGHDALDADRRAHDILGVSTLGAIHAGMIGFGPVAWSLMPRHDWANASDYEGDQLEAALTVAGCLPWLARFVPARYRIDPRYALDCLTDTVRAPGFDRYRHKDSPDAP